MITYVNNSNAGQYRVLYEKATKDLMARGEDNRLITPEQISVENTPLIMPTVVTAEELQDYRPNLYYRWDGSKYITADEAEPQQGATYYKADDITSLNEYFSYIKNLADINPLYTVLPLDEDVFDVNLNTRKIEIPQHFKENGVSVQGDEIAEVLYFKVNRFFDAQDLAYMINSDDANDKDRMRIYIQWRSAQAGENGKLIEGVSVPWVIDMTTYPNYILFGWPISSKITGKEGTIDFAVRFFKFQDRNITYSLSTLTHSVTVKPSLDFDITQKLRDIEDGHGLDGQGLSELVLDDNTLLIQGRLANSEIIDGSAVAGKPYFFMVTNDGPEGPLTTKVDSTVGGGTGIIDGDIQTSEGLVKEFWLAENQTTGILDVDTTFKVQGSGDGRISYQWRKLKNAPGTEEHKTLDTILYSNEFLPTTDTEAQAGKTYYTETVNGDNKAYTITQEPIFDRTNPNYLPLFERYSVGQITGVGYYIVTINNRVQNSLAKKESIEMVVSRPLKPQNNTAVVNTGILYADQNYELTLETDAEPQDKSVLTYQWYYDKNDVGIENATPIEGATDSSYTIHGSATSSAENGAEGDGYYYVIITSNMNKEHDFIYGNENGTRVTHAATKPVVTIPDTHKASYSLFEAQQVGGLKVQYEISAAAGENRDMAKDSITYQWYQYQAGDGHRVDADREAAMNGTYVFDDDIIMDGATDAVFIPPLGGYFYYCKVTNTYNGTIAEGYSPFFYITA